MFIYNGNANYIRDFVNEFQMHFQSFIRRSSTLIEKFIDCVVV
jgi:hypothetical protein